MGKLHITTRDWWTGKRGLAIDWDYRWYFEIGFGDGLRFGKHV